jgi:hypothetical protein
VKGLSKGMPEGIAEVKSPGRFHLSCDLFLKGDAYGGDAPGLDRPLYQAHGLVAQASGGRKKNGLGPIPNEELRNLGGCLLHEGLQVRPIDVAHEAI